VSKITEWMKICVTVINECFVSTGTLIATEQTILFSGPQCHGAISTIHATYALLNH